MGCHRQNPHFLLIYRFVLLHLPKVMIIFHLTSKIYIFYVFLGVWVVCAKIMCIFNDKGLFVSTRAWVKEFRNGICDRFDLNLLLILSLRRKSCIVLILLPWVKKLRLSKLILLSVRNQSWKRFRKLTVLIIILTVKGYADRTCIFIFLFRIVYVKTDRLFVCLLNLGKYDWFDVRGVLLWRPWIMRKCDTFPIWANHLRCASFRRFGNSSQSLF